MSTTTNEDYLSPSKAQPWWMLLLEGGAAAIIGALLLLDTSAGLDLALSAISIFLIIYGLLRIVDMFLDHAAWGYKLIIGLVAIAAGVFLFRHPTWSTAVLLPIALYTAGFGALVVGAIQIFRGIAGAGWGAAISGVVIFFIGLVLIAHPVAGTARMPLFLGIIGLVGGIALIIQAFRQRSA